MFEKFSLEIIKIMNLFLELVLLSIKILLILANSFKVLRISLKFHYNGVCSGG